MGQILVMKQAGASSSLIEMAWERNMQMMGMERFEEAKYTASGKAREAGQSVTGKKLLRKHIRTAEAAIAALQADITRKGEGGNNLQGASRLPREVRGTLLLIPADTLAMMTLKTLIDKTLTHPEPDRGPTVSSCANDIAKSVTTEVWFREWVAASKAETKKWAEENGIKGTPQSHAERLIKEEGVSRASLARWKRSFRTIIEQEWTTQEKYYCGDALMTAVVNALPDLWEFHHPKDRSGKTPKRVRATAEFHAAFNDSEARLSSMQAARLPMLTRPKPWKVTE